MLITGEILKKVQNDELYILKEIDRVCNKLNIHYFLAYGSLIGAVRHGGFIPWDDDLDIQMTREDYNKFLAYFNEIAGEEFFLQTRDTDECYSCFYAKIRLKGTVFGSEADRKLREMGVWVDVFPIDFVEIGKLTTKLYQRKVEFFLAYYSNMLIPMNNRSKKWKWITSILFLPFADKLDRFLEKRFRVLIANQKDTGTKKWVVFGSKNLESQFDDSSLFPLTRIEFEHFVSYAPNNVDKYLDTLYSNYRELPPIEKRVSEHDIVYINV